MVRALDIRIVDHHIGQLAIAFVKIHAKADHELIRYFKSDVFDFDFDDRILYEYLLGCIRSG